MKYYLITVEYGTQSKNRLQEAMRLRLFEENRKLIPETELENYLKFLTSELQAIQARFPKCKPERMTWWQPNYKKEEGIDDWALSGLYFVNVRLLQSINHI